MATGRLQVCAGWLAFDAGRHHAARASYTDALALSRQVSDPEVETRALAGLTRESYVLDRPREAQRLAAAAAHIAASAGGSPRLAVVPQLRHAMPCHAMNVVVPELAIQQHDAHGLREQRQDILSVYSEANAGRLDDPFYSLSRYWERLDAYASRDGFGFVTGRLGAELVGYALG